MFDYNAMNTAEPKDIYLARPDGSKIGKLYGIEHARLHTSLRDLWSVDFKVYKYVDHKQNHLYDFLLPLMQIYITDLGWFRINSLPEETQDDGEIYKSFTASGIETQLSDLTIPLLHVNCGTDTSLERFDENLNATDSAIHNIQMYIKNESADPTSNHYWGLGLLNILEHQYFSQKGWSIGEIDLSLCFKERTFEINAVDGYSFLMSDASNAFKCIFVFDRINKTISAYPTSEFGKSLNIECSFRNLLNNVNIKDKRDTLYTKFFVQGANEETELTYVNFGQNYITNLSYVLSPLYYPQTFVDKYKHYVEYRESRRKDYADTWNSYLTLQEQITEIQIRQPIDAITSKWNAYPLEDLKDQLAKFKAMLKVLEEQYTIDGQLKIEGTRDYSLYLCIKEVIIPDIESEIARQEAGGTTDPDKVDYTYNWDLYGITGLKERRSVCENIATTLKQKGYDKPWTSASASNQVFHEKQYAEYVKNTTAVAEINSKLSILEGQVSDLKKQLSTISQTQTAIVEAVAIDHPQFNFTPTELATINYLCIDTDYHDKSIEVLEETDIKEKVSLAWELLESAQDELEIECRPQTSFDLSLDNIYHIPAFQKEADRLSMGDFLFMELDGGYKTKQRIIEMDLELVNFNDTDLSFTFSDMTNAYGRIEDLRFFADSANSASKSSITQDDKKYVADTAISAANDVLNQYFNGASSVFPNGFSKDDILKLSDALSGLVDGNLTLDELKVKLAQIDNLNANSAFVKYLETNFLVSNQAEFLELTTLVAKIKAAIIGDASIGQGIIVNLTAQTATVDEAFVRQQVAQFIYVNDLVAQDISTSRFSIKSDDGGLKIVGSTMQFTNANGDICMQVGQDASGKFSFIIRDKDGSLLLDSTGLHEAAITDGLIKSNMVGDKQISKNKVDWEDAGFDIDNTGKLWMNAAQVKVDNKSLSAAFQAMSETVTGNYSTLETHASQLNQSAAAIEQLITDNTITKEDGTTISMKEQMQQTVSDVNGTVSRVGSLENNYDKVTGDITSISSQQNVFTNTLNQFGVEMSAMTQETQRLSSEVSDLSRLTDTIDLYGENVFITVNGVTNPSTITLTARPQNKATVNKWLMDNVEITSGISSDKTQLVLPFSALNGKRSVIIKAQNTAGTIYDLMTIYSVSDGQDSITVITASAAGNVFRKGETQSTTITCSVYKGVTELTSVKAYQWFSSNDFGKTWQQISGATTKTITVPLNDIQTCKQIKCKADV